MYTYAHLWVAALSQRQVALRQQCLQAHHLQWMGRIRHSQFDYYPNNANLSSSSSRSRSSSNRSRNSGRGSSNTSRPAMSPGASPVGVGAQASLAILAS